MLRLVGQVLRLGGRCLRSALAFGGALGSFMVWSRSRLAAASSSAPTSAFSATSTSSSSSAGLVGQLDGVASLSRTSPRPGVPLPERVPYAGPSNARTWRPRCYGSTHASTRPTSATEAAPCTAGATGIGARHPVGCKPRSRQLRLAAQLLNEAICLPALARASSSGQEGGARIR